MIRTRMLAYITGTVDQELLLRNEYLAAENRILRAQINGRLKLYDSEKITLAEIAYPGDCARMLSWQSLTPRSHQMGTHNKWRCVGSNSWTQPLRNHRFR